MNKIKQYKKQIIIGLAIFFAFGIGAATAKPETKIVTETRTVEKRVDVPGKTKEVLSDDCKTALVNTSEMLFKQNNLLKLVTEGVQEYVENPYAGNTLEEALARQKIVNEEMLEAATSVRICDPVLAASVDTSGE